MKTIRIEVTAEDIAVGRRGSCYYCPIAMAAWRATGITAEVGGFTLAFCGSDTAIVLPPAAQKFVDRFESERPVKPFSFDLDVP